MECNCGSGADIGRQGGAKEVSFRLSGKADVCSLEQNEPSARLDGTHLAAAGGGMPTSIKAQDTVTGAFEGIVTDGPTGVALRSALVEITNQQTGLTISLRTDYLGRFYPAVEDTDIRAGIIAVDGRRNASFSEGEISTLPLGGATFTRTFDELALLLPGVAPPAQTLGSVAGPGVGAGVGTAGQQE